MSAVALELPPEVIEEIARRAAELVHPASPESPWLDVESAARYLCAKPGRIYELKARGEVPHHKDGTRLLFHRDDLDAYMAASRSLRA